MATELTSLKPSLLWKHFKAFCQVPHCSRHEVQAGAYVKSVAEKNGCDYDEDDAGNVLIRVPASSGKENAPVVVIQGHLDMVCEKNSDVDFDFSKDAIQAYVDGEWVTAKGTTLGADNGIGVATALALIEDKDVIHGPLELLFTTDEETGLNGANALKSDFVKGRILLNLDSEEEGAFSIGCAGGGDSQIHLPIHREAGKGVMYKMMLSGLRGGHSGIDIHTGRGNAVQLLARMLYQLQPAVRLISIEGGSKHNAIPREAWAYVQCETELSEIQSSLQKRLREIQFELKAVEKEIKLSISREQTEQNPLDNDSQNRFLQLLVAIPHGVFAMSQEIPGLVETSNNLAIVNTMEDEVLIYTSTRSSILSALEAVRKIIEACSHLAGGKIEHLEGYPAWTPDLDSPLLQIMKTVYKELTGKEVRVEAIHAGLECGIIGEKYPGMDMISFGPDLKNPHSPDERVHIGSVERFWNLVTTTLEKLAQ